MATISLFSLVLAPNTCTYCIQVRNLPSLNAHTDRYKSVAEFEGETADMGNKLIEAGVLECPQQPLLTIPHGCIVKDLEDGTRKVRIVQDATAVGLNPCQADKPFPMPRIGDAVRGAKKGGWSAKYDLRDGFYHMPVNRKTAKLLGVAFPRSAGAKAIRIFN